MDVTALGELVGPLPADEEARLLVLLVEQEIAAARGPGASRYVDYAAQAAHEVTLGAYVYDADLAFGVVLGEGCGDDLYVLDLSCWHLLQGLRSREDARLAVDIYGEARAAAEGDVALGVNAHRRGVFEDVGRRPSVAHQVGRAVHYLLVEFVYQLPFFGRHHHLRQLVRQRLQPYVAEVGQSRRGNAELRGVVYVVVHVPYHDDVCAFPDVVEREHAIRVGQHLHGVVVVAVLVEQDVGEIDRRARLGIHYAALDGEIALLGHKGRADQAKQEEY